MNQNINHVFKAEDLDWKQLETIGIDKQQLEEDGNLELLLQGEETEPGILENTHSCIVDDYRRQTEAGGRTGRQTDYGNQRTACR